MNYIEWNIDPVAFWVGGIRHVLQFAVDCGDRGVRVDTETCLPGKRDTVGASPDTRDAEYCRLVSRGTFGPLPDLRVRVLFRTSIGNFAPDTG